MNVVLRTLSMCIFGLFTSHVERDYSLLIDLKEAQKSQLLVGEQS